MKRTPLRKVSKQRAKQLAAYRILKPIWLSHRPYCEAEVACLNPVDTIHHLRGRSGNLLCDERYFMAICAQHHHFIHHENPNEARRKGLLQF